MGTLRTDLRLVVVGFFPDFGGADFIGAGVFVVFLADVALLLVERLRVVFLVDAVLPALLLDWPDAFFVVALRLPAGLAGFAFAGVFLVDDPVRARLAAALVPASTVNRAGSPCLSGSTYRSLVSCRIL